MKALILAAGRGRRLWPFTADSPKCLLSVGHATILEQQLHNLERAGIGEAIVVCGFAAEHVRAALEARQGPLAVRAIYNPLYDVADNLISLWAARAEMDADFVLLNGDTLFHPDIVRRLLATDGSCCLAIDRKTAYDADDMKVELRGGFLARIGKDLPADSSHAESIGILRFSAEGAERFRHLLEEIARSEHALNTYFLTGIQELVDRGSPVVCCDVAGLCWADVDTPDDLRTARAQIHFYQEGEVPMHVYSKAKGSA